MSHGLTNDQLNYLARTMKDVSRSFALVTPHIEEPLNHYLSTAYLLCRVLDNIEDCTQPFLWQQQRFAEFVELLQNPEKAESVLAGWEAEEWPGLSLDEINMMGVAGGQPLWQIFAQIPESSRKPICYWTEAMARGMELVLDPYSVDFFATHDGVRLPHSVAEYDQYCFYVAGTVGHMATELTVTQYGIFGRVANRLLELSEACGRALQKTNIVKDFAQDLKRGVCYLPDAWLRAVEYAPLQLEGAPVDWKRFVLDNVLRELESSVAYIQELPLAAAGYRLASLLSMLPAYQTLFLAAQNHQQLFTPEHHVKISRQTMSRCLYDARRLTLDNEGIEIYARRMRQKVEDVFKQTPMIGIGIN